LILILHDFHRLTLYIKYVGNGFNTCTAVTLIKWKCQSFKRKRWKHLLCQRI